VTKDFVCQIYPFNFPICDQNHLDLTTTTTNKSNKVYIRIALLLSASPKLLFFSCSCNKSFPIRTFVSKKLELAQTKVRKMCQATLSAVITIHPLYSNDTQTIGKRFDL